MNLTLTKIATAAVFALAASPWAQAAVEPGHWTSAFGDAGPGGINYNLSVWVDQTPEGDYTGGFFTYEDGQLTGVTINVDEGSDWFLVTAGAAFSEAALAQGQFPFLIGATDFGPTQTVAVGNEFYLGARPKSGYGPSDVAGYGWGHFQVIDGVPTLVGSAMAFNEAGIIVGTMQAVPEPGTMAMLAVGLAAVSVVSRRRPGR